MVCALTACTDTASWTNNYAYTCVDYATRGWCANRDFTVGSEWTGKVGYFHAGCTNGDCATHYNNPSANCCVCGKALGSTQTIAGVVTQGWPAATQYVASYKVQTSQDCSSYSDVESGRVFPANSDTSTVVGGVFSASVQASCVRLLPQTWINYMSMRAAVLTGPAAPTPTPTPAPTPSPTPAPTPSPTPAAGTCPCPRLLDQLALPRLLALPFVGFASPARFTVPPSLFPLSIKALRPLTAGATYTPFI